VAPWWRTTAPGPARERQRQVWRVEAGGGVFDLGRDLDGWVLVRSLD